MTVDSVENTYNTCTNIPFESLFTPASLLGPMHAPTCDSASDPHNSSNPGPVIHEPRKDMIRVEIELSQYVAVFLRHTNKGMSALQAARILYLAHAGHLLVGAVEEMIVVILPDAASAGVFTRWTSSPNQLCANGESLTLTVYSEANRLWQEALMEVVANSLSFELVRCGKWIQIGESGNVLTTSEIVKSTNTSDHHRNVPAVIITPFESGITLKLEIRKYYPLSPTDPCLNREGVNVHVLPSLKPATARTVDTKRDSAASFSTEMMQNYWQSYHGYTLSELAATHTVAVSFDSFGSSCLTYPAACVWKLPWAFLPSHTNEYAPVIHAQVSCEITGLIKNWQNNGFRSLFWSFASTSGSRNQGVDESEPGSKRKRTD